SYDAYWPGGTKNTAWYKNISGLLTEVASARMATPISIAPGELSGGRKGLVEYGPQTNFPNPWPGGVWRLRDIMDYERIASDAILETCADRKEDFLRDMAARARTSIAAAGPRDAFRFPASQRDRATSLRLAQLMVDHGVEVKSGSNGDVWIPLAQPYGRFVTEMLTTQRYPEVKLVPGKEIVRPYDVAAWSLPLMMGVEAERAPLPEGLRPFAMPPAAAPSSAAAYALAPGSAENAKAVNAALRGKGSVSIVRAPWKEGGREWPAGTVVFDQVAAKAAAAAASPGVGWTAVPGAPAGAEKLTAPRVALYKPWAASMDEGWTRWVLEQYGFDPKNVDNKTIRAGKLKDAFDVLVLPDVDKEVIDKGKPKVEEGAMKYFAELPADYAGGLEKEGAKALKEFVEAGGTIVALAGSSDWVLDEFNIPVRNTLSKVKPEDFGLPGSILRVHVAPHPVTYGLPEEAAVFADAPIAFQTAVPGAEMERWVLASYPTDPRDILLSGWIRGEDRLARRAAAVAMTYGKGRIVLLGFRAQHRAQTHGTYPFLFNALYWSVAK
ncbi:MAG: hypothetical protein ABI914_08060, partial [Acidobacteriota bacterium]